MSMAEREDDEVETLSIEDNDRGDEVVDEGDAETLAAVAAAAGEDEEEEGDEPSDDGKQSQRIPYARFKEVNEELKAEREARIRMEERLKALEQGRQPEPKQPEPKAESPDVKALRRQLRAAVLEGDDDKADEIEEKIETARRAELEAIRASAVEEAKRALHAEREREAAEAIARDAREAAKAIVAEYPALDAGGKAANKEAIEDFISIRDRELAKGVSVKQAMQTAAVKVAKMHDLTKAGAKPDGKGDDPPKPTAGKLRNADAAARIPPKLSGSSGAAKPEADDLDDEAFAALPEREKRRLRGDFVE